MFGHERLEFSLRTGGKLRYTNQSNYKGGQVIHKEMYVGPAVVEEARRIIEVRCWLHNINKNSNRCRMPSNDRAL